MVLFKGDLTSMMVDINISNHPKGIYFVKVQAGDQVFTEKIIYK